MIGYEGIHFSLIIDNQEEKSSTFIRDSVIFFYKERNLFKLDKSIKFPFCFTVLFGCQINSTVR